MAHAQDRQHGFAAQCQVGLQAHAILQRSYPQMLNVSALKGQGQARNAPCHCHGGCWQSSPQPLWEVMSVLPCKEDTACSTRLQKPVPDHHKRQKAVSTSLCLTRLTCVLPLASMLPRLDCTLLQALRENILRTLPMLFAHWSTDTIRLLRMSLRVFVHLVRVRSSTVMAPCKLPSAWQQEAGSFLLLALVVRGPAINLALPNTGACIHRLAVFSSARRYDDAYSGNGPIIECPRACPSADATLKARWLPRPAGLRQPGAQ